MAYIVKEKGLEECRKYVLCIREIVWRKNKERKEDFYKNVEFLEKKFPFRVSFRFSVERRGKTFFNFLFTQFLPTKFL